MQRIGDKLQNLPEMIANQKAMLFSSTQPQMHSLAGSFARLPTLGVSLQDLSVLQVLGIINLLS